MYINEKSIFKTMKKYLKLKNLLYVIVVVFAYKGIKYYQEDPTINEDASAKDFLPLLALPVFIFIFSLIVKLIFKIFAKNRNFSALKFSKQIIIYFIIFPPLILLALVGLSTTEINEKPIGVSVVKYFDNRVNNKEKPDSKVSFSQAETFMKDKCKKINQTLMKGKESEMNGIKIYAFMSVAQNGMACISIISENELALIKSDCGNSKRKINEFKRL